MQQQSQFPSDQQPSTSNFSSQTSQSQQQNWTSLYQPGIQHTPHQQQAHFIKDVIMKYALTSGILLALFTLVESFIRQALLSLLAITGDYLSLYFRFPYIALLFFWAIYFLTGLFAARRTQKLGVACIISLWASLGYLAMFCLLSYRSLFEFFRFLSGRISDPTSIIQYSSYIGFEIFLHIGVGIGVCILGGLLGKRLAQKKQAPTMLHTP